MLVILSEFGARCFSSLVFGLADILIGRMCYIFKQKPCGRKHSSLECLWTRLRGSVGPANCWSRPRRAWTRCLWGSTWLRRPSWRTKTATRPRAASTRIWLASTLLEQTCAVRLESEGRLGAVEVYVVVVGLGPAWESLVTVGDMQMLYEELDNLSQQLDSYQQDILVEELLYGTIKDVRYNDAFIREVVDTFIREVDKYEYEYYDSREVVEYRNDDAYTMGVWEIPVRIRIQERGVSGTSSMVSVVIFPKPTSGTHTGSVEKAEGFGEKRYEADYMQLERDDFMKIKIKTFFPSPDVKHAVLRGAVLAA